MHTSEKRRAAPGSTAQIEVEINDRDNIEISSAAQRRAAARLAAQFGLSLSVALVVAALAGLGGRPA